MELIILLQVGLKGEDLGLSSGSSRAWNSQTTFPKNQPLIWYKVIVFSIYCFPWYKLWNFKLKECHYMKNVFCY